MLTLSLYRSALMESHLSLKQFLERELSHMVEILLHRAFAPDFSRLPSNGLSTQKVMNRFYNELSFVDHDSYFVEDVV